MTTATKPLDSRTGSAAEKALLERYRRVRALSMELASPLAEEDYRVQSMPDVSPPWWNLGHTTWFFAKNILEAHTDFRFQDPGLEFALNSYYETHGERLQRDRRGSVSRPTTRQILEFRRDVDQRMSELIVTGVESNAARDLAFLVETGLQHEQQHQELMVTEIKHILGSNPEPLRRFYRPEPVSDQAAEHALPEMQWHPVADGIYEIGADDGEWKWDNEGPRHRVFSEPFEISNRLVEVHEFVEFTRSGGYRDPLLWLANGWQWISAENIDRPLYWEELSADGEVTAWTLAGERKLDPREPVCHVSFYEADAYARWRSQQDGDAVGCRLPTEAEWEVAARLHGFDPLAGNFCEDGLLHPRAARGTGFEQAAGDVWEWTTSHYEPYPGYRPFAGALMEYNGKFMDNQRVLRGGSCATPRDHIRPSYRNFWPAETQFQYTGIRLARSV